MLRGGSIVRVHWMLDTDQLRAVCHCGATRLFEDPIVLWEWVLAHPDGHEPGGAHTGSDTETDTGPGRHDPGPGTHVPAPSAAEPPRDRRAAVDPGAQWAQEGSQE